MILSVITTVYNQAAYVAEMIESVFEIKIVPLLCNKYREHDQDIINLVFRSKIKFLDNKYNYTFQKSEIEKCTTMPSIIHFIIFKPWNSLCAYSDLWWCYYKKTSFYSESDYLIYQHEAYKEINRHVRVGKLLKSLGVYRLIDILKPN